METLVGRFRRPLRREKPSAARSPARNLTWLAGALLVVVTLLAGCGSVSGSPSAQATNTSSGASSKVCQQLSTLNNTLNQLAGMGDNATVGSVRDAQAKLNVALNAATALPGGGGNAVNNLKAANDQLTQAMAGLPDSAPVSQIGPKFQAFKSKIAGAQTTLKNIATLLKCPS